METTINHFHPVLRGTCRIDTNLKEGIDPATSLGVEEAVRINMKPWPNDTLMQPPLSTIDQSDPAVIATAMRDFEMPWPNDGLVEPPLSTIDQSDPVVIATALRDFDKPWPNDGL
ncbi:hypothetical protein HDU76_009965, partial [Blyttiomyces sp. JEL0837]